MIARQGKLMRAFSFAGILMGTVAMIVGLNGTAAKAQTITTNQTGSNGGFFYSFWTSQSGPKMTLGSNGNYAVTWSNFGGDFTCGKGWSTGSNRQIGYNCGVYSNSGGGSLSVYGWTENPLVEYYITQIGNVAAGSEKGTLTSDGASYTIWENPRNGQPSIIGTANFEQYISQRSGNASTGTNNTVTTANHFNAWASHGMNLGSFNYQILLTEGFGGSGNVNATVWTP